MKPRARTIVLVLAGALAVSCGWAVADLTVIKHGVVFVDPDGFAYRVRPGSWVNGITGADATTIGNTIHLKWPRKGEPAPSRYLIAHEWRHLWQRRESVENPNPTRSPLFELRYLIGGPWKDSIEATATTWGMQHYNDHHFLWVAEFLATKVEVR